MIVECNLVKRLDNPLADVHSRNASFGGYMGLIPRTSESSPTHERTDCDCRRDKSWFEGSGEITCEERDFLACQGARHALRIQLRRCQADHLAFQQRYDVVDPFLADPQRRRRARVFLNPIRTWRRFTSRALLDDDAQTPADVLFFAMRGHIAMAHFGLEGKALLNELSDFQPCPLSDWSTHSSCGRHFNLDGFVCHLVDLGIVSFG